MNIITIILGAVVGSLLTYFFAIRTLRTETELRLKAEKYDNLIKYLRGFIGKTAKKDLKEKFITEWESSWLYCSDEVFKNINRLMEHVRMVESSGNYQDGRKILGDIIISMRKDLLGKKTRLSNEDFIFWEVHPDRDASNHSPSKTS